MTCGIYKLVFNGTDKIYVGKSVNIEYRYKGHLRSFKRGESSKKMKEAYETYGAPNLEILEECQESELDLREIFYIASLNTVSMGFNSRDTATNSNTSSIGELNHKSKYSNAKIIECFDLLIDYPDMLFQEIAEITGIPRGSVSMIAHGGNHKWLKLVYPERYGILIDKVGDRKTSCKSALKQGIEYPIILCPSGIEYKVNNAREFARTHGLDQSALGRVLNGKAKTHKGWKLKL